MGAGVSYSLGKFIKRNPEASIAIILAALWVGWMLVYAWREALKPTPKQPSIFSAKAPVAPPVPAAPVVDPMIAKCAADLPQIMATAKEQLRKKEGQAAVDTLYPCRDHFTDPQQNALYVKAGEMMSIQAAKRADAEAAALKKQKKREGVSLGMSQEDAVDSSWGKPRKINRSIGSYGTHEQWVYDGGYLYFENGVLTSIQN